MNKQTEEINGKINQEIESISEFVEVLDREITEMKFRIEKSHLDLILTLDSNINTGFENLNIQ